MAKRPRALKPIENKASELVAALKFVGSILSDIGAPYETHVLLGGSTATAFNGVLSAGHPIDEDLSACPHAGRFLDALGRCDEGVSITQLDSGRLSVKSGRFRAFVPCVDAEIIPTPYPDPPCATVTDDFKQALDAMAPFGKGEGAQSVALASVLMAGRSLVGTDGALILECWHGCDLPPGLALPRVLVAPLCKVQSPLASFGYSSNSATFYFENRSWIKTQLYADKWPDLNMVLNRQPLYLPVPANFWEAFASVSPFCENDCLTFADNQLRSHSNPNLGASYDVDDLPSGMCLSAKRLKIVQPHVKEFDFIGVNGVSYFRGDKARGALAQIREY